jgi:hypothetical protein
MTAPRAGVVGWIVALAAMLAACGERAAPPVAMPVDDAAPTPEDLAAEREAVHQASRLHRLRIDQLLGPGQALADTCRPNSFESVRLTVDHARHRISAFVVDLGIDAHGDATATWHVFPWDAAARKYAPLPPRAMRLDGPGWQQARQLVTDPRFAQLPPVDAVGLDGATWTVEACVGTRYSFMQRWDPKATDAGEFVRVARALAALAGSVCRLPGEQSKSDHLASGEPPPC